MCHLSSVHAVSSMVLPPARRGTLVEAWNGTSWIIGASPDPHRSKTSELSACRVPDLTPARRSDSPSAARPARRQHWQRSERDGLENSGDSRSQREELPARRVVHQTSGVYGGRLLAQHLSGGSVVGRVVERDIVATRDHSRPGGSGLCLFVRGVGHGPRCLYGRRRLRHFFRRAADPRRGSERHLVEHRGEP